MSSSTQWRAVGLLVFVALALAATIYLFNRSPDLQAVNLPAAQKFEEASAAFSGNAPPVPPEYAGVVTEIEQFFGEFAAAVATGSDHAVGKHFDYEAMFEAVRLQGGFKDVAAVDRNAQIEALEQSYNQGMAADMATFGWPIEICHVRVLDNDDEAVVYSRHHDASGELSKMCWWLVRSGGRWRIYDFEYLDVAHRITTHLAMSYPKVQDNLPWVSQYDVLMNAESLAIENKLDEARQKLQQVTGVAFPGVTEARRWRVEALVNLSASDYAAALLSLDKAEAAYANMPIIHFHRAQTCWGLGRHEDVLRHLDRYTQMLGTDEDVLELRGDALVALGRNDEASDAYRKALADYPQMRHSLYWLAKLVGDDAVDELASHLKQLEDLSGNFQWIADDLVYDERLDALKRMVAALKAVDPKNIYFTLYDAHLKHAGGNYAEAAAQLERVIPRVTDKQTRRRFVERYLLNMLELDKAVEGYQKAEDRAYAFSFLADRMLTPPRLEALRALLDARRADDGSDVWIEFYTGQSLVVAQKYEQAETHFARGMALPLDQRARRRFRYARVNTLYHAGKGLDAYQKVEPAKDTFDQLKWLYAEDADADGLAELVRRYRADGADGAELQGWDAEVMFLKKQYSAAIDLLRRNGESIRKSSYGDWRVNDRLVRSLVRTRRFAEAEQALQPRQDKDNDNDQPLLKAVVYAAQARVADATKQIEQCFEDDYELYELYEDPDLGPALRSDAFEAFREKHPEPRAKGDTPPPAPG